MQLSILILHLKKDQSKAYYYLTNEDLEELKKIAIMSERNWTFKNWVFAMRIMNKIERINKIASSLKMREKIFPYLFKNALGFIKNLEILIGNSYFYLICLRYIGK